MWGWQSLLSSPLESRDEFATIAGLLEVTFSQQEAKGFGRNGAEVCYFCCCVGTIQCSVATVRVPPLPRHSVGR